MTGRAIAPLRGAGWLLLGVLAIVACGPAGPTDGATDGATPIDVVGRVTDVDGAGVSGMVVAVEGRPTDVTDAFGAFTIPGVTPPYDLVVATLDGGDADVFLGVSDPTPDAVLNRFRSGGGATPTSSTILDVTLVGSDVDAGEMLMLCVENDVLPMGYCGQFGGTATSPYGHVATWSAPTDVTATVRAVLYAVDGEGMPTGIVATGTNTVTVSDKVPASLSVSLTAPVHVAALTVHADVPDGHRLVSLNATGLLPSGLNALKLPYGTPILPTAILPLPDVAGLGAIATAAALDDAGGASSSAWVLVDAPDGATVQVPLADVPALLAPAPGGALGPGSVVEIADRSDAGHIVTLRPDAGFAGPEYALHGFGGVIGVPDLSWLDPRLALPSGASYRLQVYGYAPVSGPDGLVRTGGMIGDAVRLLRATAYGWGGGPSDDGATSAILDRGVVVP